MNLNPFRHITKLLEKILMNQQELAQALTDVQTNVAAISAAVDKVGVESQATLQKVSDLEAALNSGGTVSPEVQSAFDAVKASVASLADKVTAVDDLIPDAPTV
jgi:methyl-accepting chemotaxis protein